MQEKRVYLLVSDLHYAVTKANRLNYLREILDSVSQIVNIAEKYRATCTSVNLILLGDVIDGPLTNPEDAMRCIDFFHYFASVFDKVYCVLGNHEETYTVNNPFWFLVEGMDIAELSSLSKAIQPQSISPCIFVPSTLHDGDVTFYFNHYGMPPKIPNNPDEVSIGLFHQNVGSNDICKMWGTFENVEEVAYVQSYSYLFFAHMHMAYGKYYLNEQHTCVGEWLGCIGRTNVLEVEQCPLSVNIPAILIEGGKFVGVEDNSITRLPPKECIDYDKLKLSSMLASQVEITKAAIPTTALSSSLYDSVKVASSTAGLDILVDLFDKPYDFVHTEYIRSREGLSKGSESSE